MGTVERRRYKRLPITLHLTISNLFCQDNVKANLDSADIEVFEVSAGGIGFRSKSILPLNYYFNAKIVLGDPDNIIYAVIKIIRSQEYEHGFIYGCEFVGLPDILKPAFQKYENMITD